MHSTNSVSTFLRSSYTHLSKADITMAGVHNTVPDKNILVTMVSKMAYSKYMRISET